MSSEQAEEQAKTEEDVDTSRRGLSPLQKAMAGVAKNAKMKKLAKETGKTDLQLAVLEAPPPPKEKKPMLKEVSGTLDRIKKLGAKNKEGQTREAMLKLFQQKKKEAIEAGEDVPSLLDKNVVEMLNKELGMGAEEGTKK